MLALKKTKRTLAQVLREGVLKLQKAHVESASLDARLLMEHVLGCSREALLISPDAVLSKEQEAQFAALIEARSNRKPIAQLIGKREFYGRNFKVSEFTLDPRPDSETVIEALLQQAPKEKSIKIIDLGTGSGCLLLTLLAELPQATGIGVDISDNALAVAEENARSLELSERARFIRSRWAAEVSGTFDVIISNPPYIPTAMIDMLAPEVAKYEPRLALDGGEDGLECYREIMKSLPALLAPEGVAAFEIGVGQELALTLLANEVGLQVVEIRPDLAGVPRAVVIRK
jgi:release factor glutamine methyltransferase